MIQVFTERNFKPDSNLNHDCHPWFFRNLGTTNFKGHQWLVLKILLSFQVNTKNIRKTSFVATLVFSLLTTKFTSSAVCYKLWTRFCKSKHVCFVITQHFPAQPHNSLRCNSYLGSFFHDFLQLHLISSLQCFVVFDRSLQNGTYHSPNHRNIKTQVISFTNIFIVLGVLKSLPYFLVDIDVNSILITRNIFYVNIVKNSRE